jgi:protein phosphatase
MTLDAVAASGTVGAAGRASDDGVLVGRRVVGVADGADRGLGSGQLVLAEVSRLLGPRPRLRHLGPALHAANFAAWFHDDRHQDLVANVTIAVWSDTRVAIGHVGDARAYLVRDGAVEPLTTDQAPSGDDDEVPRLGRGPASPPPEIRVVNVGDGDRLILCTDGLWRNVAGTDLAAVTNQSAEEACEALCRAASPLAAEDATVVVVAFSERRAW